MRTEDRNAVYRLELVVTGVFSLGLFLGWPLAVVGAVFTALFLQAPAALPLAAFAKLFIFPIALMFVSFLLSSVFAPYPVVFPILEAIGVILSFIWSVPRAGVLPDVIALMGALMIPNLVLQSRDLALVLVFWIPLNLLLAGFVSTLMFTLIPAPPRQPRRPKPHPPLTLTSIGVSSECLLSRFLSSWHFLCLVRLPCWFCSLRPFPTSSSLRCLPPARPWPRRC